ncbi:threonine/serine exporter family protein [Lentilactobacillus sp. Marseille-Q4993]|uniref:threonine/serine exporter family protein n=1 Tax=Lentilactobacillus sp. Marseille-Q4993 TaxID=3039492 RepID=UPI0024BBF251|nr:threonine/serine exporter family protein [Lentilactobacillus sp. Marseille-Q4993]
MQTCGKVGTILLTSGAETSRVEQTVEYIGHAAGVAISCYVTMTAVFISVNQMGRTMMFKTKLSGFNLQKVDELNQASRQFTAHQISYDKLKEELERIDHQVIEFNWPTKILGAGLVSVAPMFLFKATWGDLGLSFFIGIVGFLATMWVANKHKTPYIKELAGGFTIALLSILAVKTGIGIDSDKMIVSSLMPLVPGVAITNSFREIMAGEIISGLVRGVDAVLVAIAIGSGVVLATSLLYMIGG